MLTGEWKRGIDSKNRLVVPAELRDAFVMGGYVSDQGGYIGLFPAQEFRDFLAKLQQDVENRVVDRGVLRTVAGRSFPFSLDAAGRVVLPAALRGRLPDDGEVVLVGSLTHVAIESPDSYHDNLLSAEELGDALRYRL